MGTNRFIEFNLVQQGFNLFFGSYLKQTGRFSENNALIAITPTGIGTAEKNQEILS